jgi:hypothetical protein
MPRNRSTEREAREQRSAVVNGEVAEEGALGFVEEEKEKGQTCRLFDLLLNRRRIRGWPCSRGGR